MDDIGLRIKRIHAAIGASQELNVGTLVGQVIQTPRVHGVFQDFSGGQSEEDLSNIAHSTISNIAHLHDHLKGWARRNGKDSTRVRDTLDRSLPLKIIMDLANNDKHGYPPREGGHSSLAPKLINVGRVMQLRGGTTSDWTVMTLGNRGQPIIEGSGSGRAVVTGLIIDKSGKAIGDLFDMAEQAIQAWEQLVSEFGLS
jgi:hypothetical protein